MTAAELQAKYPDAVRTIEQAAVAAARPGIEEAAVASKRTEIEKAAVEAAKPGIVAEAEKAERAKASEFINAFSDDPKYAIESFASGKSVLQAKADRHDTLAAKLKEQASKPAAPASPVAQGVSFISSDNAGQPASANSVEGEAIADEAIKAKWDSDPAVRKEYGEFKYYSAYVRANEKNLIKEFKPK